MLEFRNVLPLLCPPHASFVVRVNSSCHLPDSFYRRLSLVGNPFFFGYHSAVWGVTNLPLPMPHDLPSPALTDTARWLVRGLIATGAGIEHLLSGSAVSVLLDGLQALLGTFPLDRPIRAVPGVWWQA